MSEILECKAVSKKYCCRLQSSMRYGLQDIFETIRGRRSDTLRHDEFWSLRDISFKLERGESVGILGRNGAGKSTLLRILAGQLSTTLGSVTSQGNTLSLTQLGVGFNPVLTGRENVYISAATFGLTRRRTDTIMNRIIEFAGIGRFIDSPLQTYSSGMRARLGYAISANIPSDVLLLDEVLAVGDIAFRRKCFQHIHRYLDQGGAMILVSHDAGAPQVLCSRCLVLDQGRLVFAGPSTEAVHFYQELMESDSADQLDSTPGRDESATEESGGKDHIASVDRSKPADGLIKKLTDVMPVRLDSIELLPLGVGTSLRTGASARVVFRYRSRGEMTGVGFVFRILTPDLSVNIASGIPPEDAPGFRLAPGSGELECQIPRLPLQPGRYALRGRLVELKSGSPLDTFGRDGPPAFFHVTAQACYQANLHRGIGDLVELPVDWSFADQRVGCG